jgi:3-oxoacyl-[acyl-carrier protein] reductase
MRLSTLSRSVTGARVVVTGAGSGMGRATAHLFADEGARVLVVDRNPATIQQVVDEIESAHGPGVALGASGDVSLASDRLEIVRAIVDAWGGVDVLVNNAGVSLVSSVFSDDEMFASNWDQTLAINVSAHAHMIRACLPHLMKAPNGGRVVNIASTEAVVATGGISAYTASKHAVIGLTKSFAVELGRHNVTVNAVCPGPIETAMTAGINDEAKEKYSKRKVPLRRYGMPEEVAHMTLSLCLPASSFVNGSAVVVDGGMSIKHG